MRQRLDKIHCSSRTEPPTGWTVVFNAGYGPDVVEIDYDPATPDDKQSIINALDDLVCEKINDSINLAMIYRNRHADKFNDIFKTMAETTHVDEWVGIFEKQSSCQLDLFYVCDPDD